MALMMALGGRDQAFASHLATPETKAGKKTFLAVNHLLALRFLKQFTRMAVTIFRVIPGIKRLVACYTF